MLSAREWVPGDVAMVTWTDSFDGEVQTQVRLRVKGGETDRPAGQRRDAWWGRDGYLTDDVAELAIRPLVVIDFEDREQVERLWRIWTALAPDHRLAQDCMQAALREFANPTPPRMDEPGIWGVVEASCCHSDERRKWIRHEDNNWWPAEVYDRAMAERVEKGRDPRLPDGWDDLADPVLVREGVTP